MARPPKDESEKLSHDARALIPKWLADAIEEDAAAQLVTPSDVMRAALMAKYGHLAPAKKKAPAAKKKPKE